MPICFPNICVCVNKRHEHLQKVAFLSSVTGQVCHIQYGGRADVSQQRAKTYIQYVYEPKGAEMGGGRRAQGGNGRGSVVGPWHEWTMFGNGGLALPVCSFLLLQLPVLPRTSSWSVKVSSLQNGCFSQFSRLCGFFQNGSKLWRSLCLGSLSLWLCLVYRQHTAYFSL